jgi:HEAT repeat protein
VAAREGRLAEALALFAPARAVAELTPRLDTPNSVRRKNLRVALAQATRSPAASDALKSALGDTNLPPRVTVDLLRSLGERAARFPEATAALSRLLSKSPTLDTRYLLLRPAAHLSADAGARKFLENSLTRDESPLVRSAAAEIAGESTGAAAGSSFVRPLTSALADPNVRVRSAAARSLGALRAKDASEPLRGVLEDDDWPLARLSAAEALGELPADPKVDGALAEALDDDDSPSVRARSARALGSRGASQHAELLRDVLDDDEVPAEVRREAATALGALCDADAVSLLTSEAKRLADPMLETGARSVASASVRALGRIRPSDLADRLAPLLTKKSPPPARAVAQSVLDEASTGTGGCRKVR